LIDRRKLITGTTALATMIALPCGKVCAAAYGTIPGAIRWDAWYGGGPGSEANVNQQVARSLSPQRWQFRAPWFASPSSPSANVINGNQQATMDAEIGYAASAGLKYWAYVWYGQGSPSRPMMNAWNLHQASAARNNMNWCMLLTLSRIGPPSALSASIPNYVSYFQRPNYQRMLGNCPLLYVFIDNLSFLTTRWNDSWENVRTAFNALRSATTAVGLGTPYIVIMNGRPVKAAGYAAQTGADAISNYISGSPGVATPWPTYEVSIESYWAAMGATGTPIVPIAMTGWDPRPRAQTPPSFIGVHKPREDVYVVAPTADQLSAHLQAAVSYVVSHPTQCPSKAILIYSWDECDEGGNAIIPTYTGGPPGTSRIASLRRVTW
jgi:hypothetical protein